MKSCEGIARQFKILYYGGSCQQSDTGEQIWVLVIGNTLNILKGTAVMEQENGVLVGNYDNKNIESIRRLIEIEESHGVSNKSAYTMLQKNASCEVNITESSRKKCAKAIIQ